MMTSMQQAIAGESFYFALGPAIVGALIHMMVGVMYGIVFAIIVRVARLHGVVLIISGLVYGAVVFVISAWIGLPLAAAILSSVTRSPTWLRWSDMAPSSPSTCCSV